MADHNDRYNGRVDGRGNGSMNWKETIDKVTPTVDYSISLPNVLSLVTAVFIMGAAYASLLSDIEAARAYITAQTTLIDGRLELIQSQLAGQSEQNSLRINSLDQLVESELRNMNKRLDEIISRMDRRS